MSNEPTIERCEIKLKQPNPMFEKWLEEWLQEAETHDLGNAIQILETCLESLRKFPLPLASGTECGILRGFNLSLCNAINEKQQENPATATSPQAYQDAVQECVNSVKKQKRKKAATRAKAPKPPKEPKPPKLTKAQQLALAEEEERQRQVTMSPGSFKVMLLVDTHEVNSKSKRKLDQTKDYIESLQIPYEVHHLTVGDFLWVACDSDGNKLVLPYIVERKRMDDLSMSIRDGRFHEQKFRLKNSKVQNIIYLIEDYGDNEQMGLPMDNLLQAVVNTLVQNDMIVKHVENHWRAMMFLKVMTSTLTELFKDKVLIGTAKDDLKPYKPTDSIVGLMKFSEFYKDSARNSDLTIREVFVQQLLQLHSLSFEKALAIVDEYPTPRCLLDAYNACSNEQEARMLLASIRVGKMQRPIGEKISKAMHDFYREIF